MKARPVRMLPPIEERPWLTIEEVAGQLGMSKSAAVNLLVKEKFPVPTEKLGQRRIVMKAVLDRFWELRKQRGLAQLCGEKQLKVDAATSATRGAQ